MALLRFEPDLCLYVNTFLSVVVLEMINRNGFCLKDTYVITIVKKSLIKVWEEMAAWFLYGFM